MPSNHSTTPPRQCVAFSTSTDGLCGRDTYDLIEIGLVTTPPKKRGKVMVEAWEIFVEVPVCDQHEGLLTAITEQVEPMAGADVKHLDGDGQVMPTFRMSVNGRTP